MRRGLITVAIVAVLAGLLVFLDSPFRGSPGAPPERPSPSLPSGTPDSRHAGGQASQDSGRISTDLFFEHELRVRVKAPRGFPLVGATVELSGAAGSHSRTTDGAGVAKFRPPRPGHYEVKADLNGYAGVNVTVMIPRESSCDVTLGYERVIRGWVGDCPVNGIRVLVHGTASSLDGASGLRDGAGTTREVCVGPLGIPPPRWSCEDAWFEIGNLPLGSRFALTVVHPTHAPRLWEIADIAVENRVRKHQLFWPHPLHAARLRFVDAASSTVVRPVPPRAVTFKPSKPGQSWRSRPFLGESWLVASGTAKPDPRDFWLIGHCSEDSERSTVRGTVRTALAGFEEVPEPIEVRPIDQVGEPQVVALRRCPGAVLTRFQVVDGAGGEPLISWSGRISLLTLDRESAVFRGTISTDDRGFSLAVALPPGSYLVGGDPRLVGGARVRVSPSGGTVSLRARRGGDLEVLALDENGDRLRHYVLFLQPRHPRGANRPESRRQTIRHADPVVVRHLAPGPWSCTIMAPGYPEREKVLDIAAGASTSWEARMGP